MADLLRVLVVCDHFAARSSGGSERVALEVFSRLHAQGSADVRLVTSLPAGEEPPEVPFPVLVSPAHDLSRRVGVEMTLAGGVRRLLREQVEGFAPDVVHAQSLHFLSTLAAASLRTRVPLVTTAHLASLTELHGPVKVAATGYEQTLGRWVVRRSTRMIAVSDSVRAHLLGLGARPDRVEVVPNGVDPARFARREGSREPGRLVLGLVGRLIANKGPTLALDALAGLRRRGVDARLVVAGDGPMLAALTERVRAEGLSEHVEFLGFVTDVAPVMAGLDVLVRPSLTEGLPLAVLEAQASEVCVALSDVSGNRDLVVDGESGLLLPPRDVEAWVRALHGLAQDPARRARLAEAGRTGALRLGWDATAEGTRDVLARVAGR